jgi:hypothetical protein
MDSISTTEINERRVRINTFARFNRWQSALNEAYGLRLDITLSGQQEDKVWSEISEMLSELELTIVELEKKKFSQPGYRLLKALRRFHLMLTGKVEEPKNDL